MLDDGGELEGGGGALTTFLGGIALRNASSQFLQDENSSKISNTVKKKKVLSSLMHSLASNQASLSREKIRGGGGQDFDHVLDMVGCG